MTLHVGKFYPPAGRFPRWFGTIFEEVIEPLFIRKPLLGEAHKRAEEFSWRVFLLALAATLVVSAAVILSVRAQSVANPPAGIPAIVPSQTPTVTPTPTPIPTNTPTPTSTVTPTPTVVMPEPILIWDFIDLIDKGEREWSPDDSVTSCDKVIITEDQLLNEIIPQLDLSWADSWAYQENSIMFGGGCWDVFPYPYSGVGTEVGYTISGLSLGTEVYPLVFDARWYRLREKYIKEGPSPIKPYVRSAPTPIPAP